MHAELGGDGGAGQVDGGTTPGIDAGAQPGIDAAPDAPACANGRVVFLNFDGVTLTDALASDATLNRASWMTTA